MALKPKFDIINEMNEAIKSIYDTSFKIRLCALNSQISISSIMQEKKRSIGFSPISTELIRISTLLEKRTKEVFYILYETLQLGTKERKVLRSKNLQKAFFKTYHSNKESNKFDLAELEISVFKKYDFALTDIGAKINTHIKSLDTIIVETIKLCKYSRPIVYSVKIESAYVGDNLEVFHQLSEELSNSLSKIDFLLKQIQILSLELQNYKGI